MKVRSYYRFVLNESGLVSSTDARLRHPINKRLLTAIPASKADCPDCPTKLPFPTIRPAIY